MSDNLTTAGNLAEQQHGVVARWQMTGMTRGEIGAVTRRLTKVYRGVFATRELDELGRYMAAALALGPAAVVSHLSALMMLALRPYRPGPIDVSVPGRGGRERREDLVVHRPRLAFEAGTYRGIPVTSPTQSLVDARLRPHELYRALEEADRRNVRIDRSRLAADVVDLHRRISGRTRSDTEAALLLLLAPHLAELPRVNHVLNGYETDFHWHRAGLVVEVDGFHHHREREPFARDRRSGLLHRAAGYEVVRVNADDVYDQPQLVLAALRSAAPAIFIRAGAAATRPRPPAAPACRS